MTVRLSELQASGHCKLLKLGRLSEPQANCKRAVTVASVTWSLERAVGRSSEQYPVHLFFVFVSCTWEPIQAF